MDLNNLEQLKKQMQEIELSMNAILDERDFLQDYIAEHKDDENPNIQAQIVRIFDRIIELQNEKIKLNNQWREKFLQVARYYNGENVMPFSSQELLEAKGIHNVEDVLYHLNEAEMNLPLIDSTPQEMAIGDSLSKYLDYENTTWQQANEYVCFDQMYDKCQLQGFINAQKLAKEDYCNFVENYLKVRTTFQEEERKFTTSTGETVKIKATPNFAQKTIKMIGSKIKSVGKNIIDKLKSKFTTSKTVTNINGKTFEARSAKDLEDQFPKIAEEIHKTYPAAKEVEYKKVSPIAEIKPKDFEELDPEKQEAFKAIHQKQEEAEMQKQQANANYILPTEVEDYYKDVLKTTDPNSEEYKLASNMLASNNNLKVSSLQNQETAIRNEIATINGEINNILNSQASAFGLTDEENKELEEKRAQRTQLEAQLATTLQEQKAVFEANRNEKIAADKLAQEQRIDEINKRNAIEEAKNVLSHLQTDTGVYNINGLSDEEILDVYHQIKDAPNMQERLSAAREAAKNEANQVNTTEAPAIFEQVPEVKPISIPEPIQTEPVVLNNQDTEPMVAVPTNDTITIPMEPISDWTPATANHYESVRDNLRGTPDGDKANTLLEQYYQMQDEKDKEAAMNSLHEGKTR